MARLSELTAIGATAATVSRLEREGSILRLARGLYQLPDASIDTHHSLAELAKLVPKGVICLTSALSFHGLTDQIPAKVWMAIGPKDWRPRLSYPPTRFVHFPQARLAADVEQYFIEGVSVPVFGVARTLADLFRYRRTVGINVAIEGLREALKQRSVPVADIAQQAADAKIWNAMEPYVMALTSDA
jgi:predicted transcriptional regulator of viral defense system